MCPITDASKSNKYTQKINSTSETLCECTVSEVIFFYLFFFLDFLVCK